MVLLKKIIDYIKNLGGLRQKRLFLKVSISSLIAVCIAYLAVWVVFLVPHLMVAAQAWQYLMVDYVEISKVSPNELFSKALSGLQSSITNRDVSVSEGIIESMIEIIDDPYTKYLTPAQYQAASESISGSFVGIGIVMAVNKNDQLEILATMPDYPAEIAGIEAGDIILSIDDHSADGQTTGWAAGLLRGEADTNVVLGILHDGDAEPVQITVTRQEIDLPSVVAEEIEENIVYIKLNSFSENSGEDFRAELGKFLDEDTIGIIVDVRDNPGGIVDDAITITSQFINEESTVAHQVDGNFDITYTYTAKSNGLATDPDIRVAVLQNNDSASASEIFAGALRDARSNDTTAIIGTSSYGKGSINYIIELVDSSAIIITSAYWTTPDGRYIGSIGLTPDITVEDEEAQLEAALDYIKGL
ncbi:S41 family peptidase [Chloroflexota bacterium]